MGAERDPRMEPRVGDKFRNTGVSRYTIEITLVGRSVHFVLRYDVGEEAESHQISKKGWKEFWSRHLEAIHADAK